MCANKDSANYTQRKFVNVQGNNKTLYRITDYPMNRETAPKLPVLCLAQIAA